MLKFAGGVAAGSACTLLIIRFLQPSATQRKAMAQKELALLGPMSGGKDDDEEYESPAQGGGEPSCQKRKRGGAETNGEKERTKEAAAAGSTDELDEIYKEQLVRNFQFFGDGQTDIMRSTVVVLGCGGVGSHCAIALARSGLGALRLVDFDRVTVSSLNRHACASLADVGRTKVECIKKTIHSFNPHCRVDAREALFDEKHPHAQLDGHNIDYIVDCIDHLPAKIGLIQWAKSKGIPLISACGAGAKCDPSRIHVTDIQHSKEDRLAKRLRDGLKQVGISEGITVCYSSERSERTLLPLKEHQTPETARQYSPFPEFRARTIPVIAPLPAIMGNACASFVLCALADQPFVATERDPLRKKTYRRMYDTMKKITDGVTREPLDIEITSLFYTSVYHSRSAISILQTGLQFMPWHFDRDDKEEWNWVPLASAEAHRHVLEGGTEEKNRVLYGEKMCATVDGLIEEAKKALERERLKVLKASTHHTY